MKVYKPLGSRVFVEKIENADAKVGGIIVDAQFIKEFTGKVIEPGDTVKYVKKGDVITFEEGAAIPVSALTPNIVWMEEDQIVSIVTEVLDEPVKE